MEREYMVHLFGTRGQSTRVSAVCATANASRLPRQMFPGNLVPMRTAMDSKRSRDPRAEIGMILERWREADEALRGVGVVVHGDATHIMLIGQRGLRVPTFFIKCFPKICRIMQPLASGLLQHHAASQFASPCSHPVASFRSNMPPRDLQGDAARWNWVQERGNSRFVAITPPESIQPANTSRFACREAKHTVTGLHLLRLKQNTQ